MAKAQGKKILLIGGDDGCARTYLMKEIRCELDDPPIRSLIERDFIPWYSDRVDGPGGIYRTQFSYYVKDVPTYEFPVICVIDPKDSGHYLDRTVGELQDAQTLYNRLLQYSKLVDVPSPSPQPYSFSHLLPMSSTGTIHVFSSSSCSWTALEQRSVDNDYRGEFGYREWNGFLFRIRQYDGYHQDRNHDHRRTYLHRYTEDATTTCASTISPTSASFSPPGHFGDNTNTGMVAVALVKQLFLECHEQRSVDNDYHGEFR